MATFNFPRPLYEFLCLSRSHRFEFGTLRRISIRLFFQVAGDYDGWFIVHRRLPPQSFAQQVFLVLLGLVLVFGFDVLAQAPAIHENPNILGGIFFSEFVELFTLEKFVSCGEKAVIS